MVEAPNSEGESESGGSGDVSETRYLVTGAAGFIGAAVTRRLLDVGGTVLGVDSLNEYYDPGLKRARLGWLADEPCFDFVQVDVSDLPSLRGVAELFSPHVIVHLAAQAGVRHSLTHPHDYVAANLVGFVNILEVARGLRHAPGGFERLVYASSSSVYGDDSSDVFGEDATADLPVSLYGATKRSNELLARSYARTLDVPSVGLRFFTVYGPWGRPDMAYFTFADKMLAGEPIEIYNGGDLYRDFTYIDDIVSGVCAAIERPIAADRGGAPHRVYNLGNSNTIHVPHFIDVLEAQLRKAGLRFRPVQRLLGPMQPGDVRRTNAAVESARSDLGYHPVTPLEDGLARFAEWYARYKRSAASART